MANEEIVYKRRPRDLGEKLLLLQRNDQLCDVAIIVNGKRIPVHSNVMVSYSDHFNNIFLKSQRKEVILNDTNEENLLALIEYCYTGIITTSIENAKSVLLLAKSLLIPTAIDGISKSLINKLDAVNCLKLWNFAQNESLMLLNKGALDYAQRHYEQVSKSEDFLALTDTDLKKLLEFKTDELESVVYDSVKNWVDHDNTSRKEHFTSLIDRIKLEKIPEEILQSDSQSMCDTDKACHGKFLSALQTQKEMERSKFKTTLLAVGADYHRTSKTMEIYDPITKEWKIIINTDCHRFKFASTMLDDKLLIIGGTSYDDFSSVYQIVVSIVNTVEVYNFQTMKLEPFEPMQHARERTSAVTLDGNIFVIGGYKNYGLKFVEKYDSTLGKWKEVAPLLIARSAHGAKVLNGKIYVVGGTGYRSSEFLSSVEEYDPSLDKWTLKAYLNEKREGHGLAVMGNYLYAVGGCNYSSVYSKTVERYDPSIDKWTYIQSLSWGGDRNWAAAGILDGNLILAGGNNSSRGLPIIESFDEKNDKWNIIKSFKYDRSEFSLVDVPLGLVDNMLNKTYTTLMAVGAGSFSNSQMLGVYDIIGKKWKSTFMLFSGMRSKYASALLDEKLMIIGGNKQNSITDTVEVFDMKTRRCESYPSMKYKRLRPKAVLLGGYVYVMGGFDGEHRVPHVEKFDSSTKSWKDVAPLTTPRDSFDVAVLNGKIYAAGGQDDQNQHMSSMEVYDPIRNKWKSCKSMIEKRLGLALTAFGGNLYAFGGFNQSDVPSASVEKYDPKTDQWTMFKSIRRPTAFLSAGNLLGNLIVAGGEYDEPAKFSSRVEMYDEKEEDWVIDENLKEERNVFQFVEVSWDLAYSFV